MATGSVTGLKNLFIEKEYTYTYNITKDAMLQISATDFKASTPAGYVPLCASRFTSGSNHIVVTLVNSKATGTDKIMIVREVTSSAGNSITALVHIIYVKTGFGITT